jgi:KH domain
MVIGSHGAVIKNLQERSNATIRVHNDKINGHHKLFTIVGGQAECAVARALIIDIIEKPRPTSSVSSPGCGSSGVSNGVPFVGTPGSSRSGVVVRTENNGGSGDSAAGGGGGHLVGVADMRPGDETKTVFVPNTCVGLVIGKLGETIRDLQARSGALIKVTPDKEATHGADSRPILICGTPQAILLAQQFVTDVVQDALARKASGPSATGGYVSSSARSTTGIGKGVSSVAATVVTADSCTNISGTELDGGADAGEGDMSVVSNGVPDSGESSNGSVHGGGDVIIAVPGQLPPSSNGHSPFVPGLQTEVLSVPNDKVGLIIGRGGVTIRALQEESGARIQVAKEPDNGSRNRALRPVTITGVRHCIEKAKQMITEKINLYSSSPGSMSPGNVPPQTNGGGGPSGMPFSIGQVAYHPQAQYMYQGLVGPDAAAYHHFAQQAGFDAHDPTAVQRAHHMAYYHQQQQQQQYYQALAANPAAAAVLHAHQREQHPLPQEQAHNSQHLLQARAHAMQQHAAHAHHAAQQHQQHLHHHQQQQQHMQQQQHQQHQQLQQQQQQQQQQLQNHHHHQHHQQYPQQHQQQQQRLLQLQSQAQQQPPPQQPEQQPPVNPQPQAEPSPQETTQEAQPELKHQRQQQRQHQQHLQHRPEQQLKPQQHLLPQQQQDQLQKIQLQRDKEPHQPQQKPQDQQHSLQEGEHPRQVELQKREMREQQQQRQVSSLSVGEASALAGGGESSAAAVSVAPPLLP